MFHQQARPLSSPAHRTCQRSQYAPAVEQLPPHHNMSLHELNALRKKFREVEPALLTIVAPGMRPSSAPATPIRAGKRRFSKIKRIANVPSFQQLLHPDMLQPDQQTVISPRQQTRRRQKLHQTATRADVAQVEERLNVGLHRLGVMMNQNNSQNNNNANVPLFCEPQQQYRRLQPTVEVEIDHMKAREALPELHQLYERSFNDLVEQEATVCADRARMFMMLWNQYVPLLQRMADEKRNTRCFLHPTRSTSAMDSEDDRPPSTASKVRHNISTTTDSVGDIVSQAGQTTQQQPLQLQASGAVATPLLQEKVKLLRSQILSLHHLRNIVFNTITRGQKQQQQQQDGAGAATTKSKKKGHIRQASSQGSQRHVAHDVILLCARGKTVHRQACTRIQSMFRRVLAKQRTDRLRLLQLTRITKFDFHVNLQGAERMMSSLPHQQQPLNDKRLAQELEDMVWETKRFVRDLTAGWWREQETSTEKQLAAELAATQNKHVHLTSAVYELTDAAVQLLVLLGYQGSLASGDGSIDMLQAAKECTRQLNQQSLNEQLMHNMSDSSCQCTLLSQDTVERVKQTAYDEAVAQLQQQHQNQASSIQEKKKHVTKHRKRPGSSARKRR